MKNGVNATTHAQFMCALSRDCAIAHVLTCCASTRIADRSHVAVKRQRYTKMRENAVERSEKSKKKAKKMLRIMGKKRFPGRTKKTDSPREDRTPDLRISQVSTAYKYDALTC